MLWRQGAADTREAHRLVGVRRKITPNTIQSTLEWLFRKGLALVPLALAGGSAGNELQTPMAVVILGGLVTSTLLNMVVLPALYVRFGRLLDRAKEPLGSLS